MAGTPQPIFPQTPKNYVIQIAHGDAQTYKTVATGGSNGTVINSLIVTSTDSSPRDVTFAITVSGTTYALGTISIPASSGNTNALSSIDILRQLTLIPGLPWDANGNKFIILGNGNTLQASALTTVTTADFISILATGGDF